MAEVTKSGLTLFAVGDVLVIDNELLKITAINGLNLTVKRGTAMGTPAASHAAGARVAAVVSAWPGTMRMDVTAGCPRANVGYGAERWSDWNARRLHTGLHAVGWDGIVIDAMGPNVSYARRARATAAPRLSAPSTRTGRTRYLPATRRSTTRGTRDSPRTPPRCERSWGRTRSSSGTTPCAASPT